MVPDVIDAMELPWSGEDAGVSAPTAPDAISLWDFQAESIEQLRQNIRAEIMLQILCAPTGSGKTVCGAYLLRECHEKGKRAVFVADRIPLIDQTSALLDHYGIPHGVIQANHWRWRPWERIQVASAQTLARRKWPDADLIIVDEAHTLHKAVLERIAKRDCVVIGLTATPFTRGLGRHYERVVSVTTTNKLIEQGRLSSFRVFSASEPDMRGAETKKGGEWTDRAAEERSMPIVGDCVAEYLKHAAGKKFIAFGATIAHCEELQRQFAAAGVVCGLYTSKTHEEERKALLREFSEPNGYLRGLVSVAALAKGFDRPDVECVIVARPLRKGFAEHIQILGRGLRAHPGKAECLVLDHAGNCVRFWGRMQEFFEFGVSELDDGKEREKKPSERKQVKPRKCPRCAHVHSPRPNCPNCGHEYPAKKSGIDHAVGVLAELGGADSSPEARTSLYAQLLWIAAERGYKEGWASHKYKERCGTWPSRIKPEPQPPTEALLRWVRSRQIAWAKATKKSA
jgi:DNA repair protein RadD